MKIMARAFGRCISGLLLLAGLVQSAPLQAETLTICYESRDARPWRTADGHGLNFDLLAEVSQKTGVQFRFEGRPWKRCLTELKANAVDGVIGASFKADRLGIGVYPGGDQPDVSKRLYTDRYILLRHKGSGVTWDGKTLGGLRGPVGVQLGYSVTDDLKALGASIDDGAPGARELAQKVMAGYIEAAAMLEGEAWWLLAQNRQFAQKLETLPVPLAEKPYFMMLSRELVLHRPQLAERLWQAIGQVRESPAYRRMEARELSGISRDWGQ